MSKAKWNRLNARVKRCTHCPRLIAHCQTIAEVKRKAYLDCDYWGKPVPNFGGPSVENENLGLLIVGLAPGAHGANRTGRMFSGDRSGDWLYSAMHKFGFANQPESVDRKDGLELNDAVVTNICRCAPPDNKPNIDELKNCRPYLIETFELCSPIVILALGSLAWKATMNLAIELEWYSPPRPRPKFGHGETVKLDQQRWLLGSYHPSQQNTFTGRLTKPMFHSVFRKAKKLIDKSRD